VPSAVPVTEKGQKQAAHGSPSEGISSDIANVFRVYAVNIELFNPIVNRVFVVPVDLPIVYIGVIANVIFITRVG
jgi:hypothetical protein